MGVEEVKKGGPFTPGGIGLSHGAERHCTVLQTHHFFSQDTYLRDVGLRGFDFALWFYNPSILVASSV